MSARFRNLMLMVFCLCCNSVIAQTGDYVDGLIKGTSSLALYVKPYDAKPQTKLELKDISFPMPVIDTDGDFLKIRIGKKEAWIDGAQVSMSKPVQYACQKPQSTKPEKVATTMGASSGCK